jgi:hypothetical protein
MDIVNATHALEDKLVALHAAEQDVKDAQNRLERLKQLKPEEQNSLWTRGRARACVLKMGGQPRNLSADILYLSSHAGLNEDEFLRLHPLQFVKTVIKLPEYNQMMLFGRTDYESLQKTFRSTCI